MTDKTEAPQAAPAPQPQPQLYRQPSVLNIAVDKVDEITAYLSAARAPERYNTTIPFVIVPNGMKVLDFEESMPHPRRVKKHVKFTDATSFISYVNKFKHGNEPQLLAKLDNDGLSMRCIFDYDVPAKIHAAVDGNGESLEAGLPMWSSHIATMSMKYHPDYAALRTAQNTMHDQEDFALFIEENTHLFKQPTGADMLELAQDLKGFKNVSFKGAKRLSNGQTQIEWSENITAAGKNGEIVVPDYITLITPIFEGFAAEEFKAAFRWRINQDRSIAFSFKLLTKLNERDAQEKMKARVQEATTFEVLNVLSFDTN